MFCSFFSDDMYIFNVHPCKILTEISLRLVRSHQDCRDLVMMFGAFANFGKCSKTFYILLRLARSHWDCWDLTKIAAILSWPLWRDKIMVRFSYISQILLKYTHFACFVHKRMCYLSLHVRRSTLWMHLHTLSVFCNQHLRNHYCRFYLYFCFAETLLSHWASVSHQAKNCLCFFSLVSCHVWLCLCTYIVFLGFKVISDDWYFDNSELYSEWNIVNVRTSTHVYSSSLTCSSHSASAKGSNNAIPF